MNMKTSKETTTKENRMNTKTAAKNNATENAMIANDLREAGYQTEHQAQYGAVKVSLKNRVIFSYEVDRALEDAGYDASQYSLTEACGSVFARAIVA